MSPRFLARICALAAILLAAMPAAGQSKSPAKSAKSWTPPRGAPDERPEK